MILVNFRKVGHYSSPFFLPKKKGRKLYEKCEVRRITLCTDGAFAQYFISENTTDALNINSLNILH